ncbi:HopJ type III effector protein [Vibrio sp. Y2-5]|uniref:HopJ type III effector protein n=1 Tax=Vibrio TaxID=662 RepID=UPI00142D9C7F|nr:MULTISPECIES: HopJ type III effector protein [Vibrio]MBD0785888.1 HopJ type III effector protein [Vibrio sp. Y2-5]NIY93897.1 HopJ type III effector protein [Vibrio diazotrophicus]
MEIAALIEKLNQQPEKVEFQEVIATIDANFDFTPTAFVNGETVNEENQNNGSCKIFAFAQLQQLTEAQTLACFGDFYRKDVLQNPDNDDHQNIRNFIRFGWAGVKFSGQALSAK